MMQILHPRFLPRRLEVELRHADKLRAVGQLAAGIAHEINTPIQFASDSVHFLRGAVSDLLGLSALAHEVRSKHDAGRTHTTR